MAASEETRTATAAAVPRALGARRSLGWRRQRAPAIIGLGLAAAIGLPPLSGLAQSPPAAASAAPPTADADSALLAPSLEGAPASPPLSRPPGQTSPPNNRSLPPGTLTAQGLIGAKPVYGSPSGFGAGDTGFDSLNTPHSKRRKQQLQGLTPGQTPGQASSGGGAPPPESNMTFTPVPNFAPQAPSQPPVLKKSPPPTIYPNKAALRPGATLPAPPDQPTISNPPSEVHPLTAANRPGAAIAPPPPERFDYSLIPPVAGAGAGGTPPTTLPPPTLLPPNTFPPGVLPQQTLPFAAPDPYAALGIRAGSFLLFPSVDLSAGYSTNPERGTGSPGSAYFVAAPELKVQSDWERHSLTADIVGSYTDYTASLVPSLNLPFLNSKIDGRIDVTRDTQILLEQRVIVSSDNPGSPNLQAQLASLPPNQDVGETLGLAQQFNRLSMTLRGTFDRATYDPSQLTNGETTSNSDRNFDQYAGIFRVGYEIDPGLKPFVEVQEDERIHDEQFDRNGLQRDSTGTTVSVGSYLNVFGSLTGEMAVGYVDRVYKDATLPPISGAIANGALIWQPTGLTSVRLTAASQVYETTVDGASGEISRDVGLQVDHAFRTWLIGTVKGGYGNDNYVGGSETDNRYFASVGLTYKFTRELSIRGEVRQDWQTSATPGLAYTATTFLLGLRLQR